ncbi:GNAT family N-acetyltransferase [Vibrio ostreicida]|uniref:GNAT family N-acetyltransferase n=1 Tax=Vibrio ostreicida TaxID=526588 RepID=A0ABT8C0Z0_9VIBR|nr:GNAT family N-acetyltransferase [Vibrio ostreicida]MDN3612329.1 GNAT family N-acetyltransferase [Vibrio ostreicida]NPD08709.1 GNAT family N-acetyltransferase [Vibrio ostreicida]
MERPTPAFATEFRCDEFIYVPISVDDARKLLSAVTSPSFPSTLPLAKIKTLKLAQRWCSDRVADWTQSQGFVWSCRRSVDSVMVGQVTLRVQNHDLALAYWVEPTYWGKGIATQMCHALLLHLHASGFHGKVRAGVHIWNDRSASVLLKLGFTPCLSDEGDSLAFQLSVG